MTLLQQAWLTYRRTVTENPWIPKLPWPNDLPGCGPFPKQQQFLLHFNTREVLYGGAARGGKTFAMLMCAAQFVGIPGYSALILRESFRDLYQSDGLILTSKEWWAGRVDWSEQHKRWTFPDGATITFGYLENDQDVYQYQGSRFQIICVDELSQHTEWRYRYLFSRLDRPADGPLSLVPLRMRATSNPGGRGHDWVKKRFITPETREPGAVFIPAQVTDNLAVDVAAYRESLSYLDPISRAQLLAGDWDAYAGGRFQRDWFRQRWQQRADYYLLNSRQVGTGSVSVFQTCDHASTVQRSAKDDPDWTVISTWGLTREKELLWLDCERFRAEAPEVLSRLKASYTKRKPAFISIEGGGTQKTIPQLARNMGLVVREYQPGNKDKLQRATRFIVLCEGGRVFLPESAPWVEQVLAELLRFTGDPKKDSHDDVVDSAAQAADCIDSVASTFVMAMPYMLGR